MSLSPQCQTGNIEARHYGRRVGSAIGSVADAVVAGLLGGTTDWAIGAAIGEMADTNILNNYRCRAYGQTQT